MTKTFISALQEQEKMQKKCLHKRLKKFQYNQEYPAGGLRCIRCGYIVKLVKTKKELENL